MLWTELNYVSCYEEKVTKLWTSSKPPWAPCPGQQAPAPPPQGGKGVVGDQGSGQELLLVVHLC